MKNEEGEAVIVENPKQFFELLLSNARQGVEHAVQAFQELAHAVRDADIKEALETRVFLSDKILGTLDQCFKLIEAQPVKASGRLQDVFIEECRAQLAEIQSPIATRLFILAKANQLIHLRMGEYVALIASADMTGHCGVGVLLESCLADDTAFVERMRVLIRNIVDGNGVATRSRIAGASMAPKSDCF
jgi:ferritin-like metal-binding protein YciE